MHILHVYKDYHPVLGGIENHIKTLAERQVAQGHRVTVLVTNPGDQPAEARLGGVDVIRVSRLMTIASTPISPGLPWRLRALHPDITHLHFPYPVGEMSQLLAGRARPYVITYHSDIVRQRTILRVYGPLLGRVLRGAARIMPTSEPYISSSPFLRPLRDHCTVIPLSVDPEPFRDAAPLLPRDELPTLLFLGRHRYYKGIDDLLRALASLPARLIIGGDGPMRPIWTELSAELGLADRVQFVGDVAAEDLPGFYASGDIFVLPANARAEAFGKVLLEAMAAGLPCVTTELGTGTSVVVKDGITGLVCRPRDPSSLAHAIDRLLVDESLRREMGNAGCARILREYTPSLLATRVERVYEEVLNLP